MGLTGLIVRISLIFFAAEMATMYLLSSVFSAYSENVRNITDAFLMLALSLPLIYVLIIRRQKKSIKLERAEARMHALLNEILKESLSTVSGEELFVSILKSAVEAGPSGAKPEAGLFLLEGGALRLVAEIGFSREYRKACAALDPRKCACGKTALAGEITCGAGWGTPGLRAGQAGHCCIPVRSGEATIGVLDIHMSPGQSYDEIDRRFLESVAAVIAKVIEFKKVEKQLSDAQKMESLGRFAGAIAHDFNNILTIFSGFGQLMAEDDSVSDNLRKGVVEMLKSARRGKDLIAQLLAFSRNRSFEMSYVDINGTIADMTGMMETLLEKKIKLKVELEPGLCPVYGNRNQIEQVVMNLAVNAKDAMPGGGVFAVRTGRAGNEANGLGLMQTDPDCGLLRLSFEDTGVGIPPEVMGSIFEPFFTTKEPGKGTGLGLSTVYGIVRQHNGTVKVFSAPGKGARFDIYLPSRTPSA